MKKLKGRDFWVKYYKRESVSDCNLADTWVFWGDIKANATSRKMPRNVADNVPLGYGNAKPEDWYPFLVSAIATGWAEQIGDK